MRNLTSISMCVCDGHHSLEFHDKCAIPAFTVCIKKRINNYHVNNDNENEKLGKKLSIIDLSFSNIYKTLHCNNNNINVAKQMNYMCIHTDNKHARTLNRLYIVENYTI